MRIALVALVTLAYALTQAAVAHAVPSFQIVAALDFVGGKVSADGSTVLYTVASSGTGLGLFDVATGQRVPGGLSTVQVYGYALSGDGKTVHGNAPDGFFEYRNGSWSLLGQSDRVPSALSDDGSVEAGRMNGRATRTTGGFAGTTEFLDDLPGGGTRNTAWGISADGSVIVGDGSSALGTEAFRWEAGVTLGLGDLAGGAFDSSAAGVSADGTTVVGTGTTAAGKEAFRWRDGNMISLGDLAGGPVFSQAFGVSGDGSVIVGRDIGAGDRSEAFIWDEAHGMRPLEAYLTELGIDLRFVDLRTALSISSDGRTIVGTGFQPTVQDPTAPGGERRGVGTLVWVVVIPEPGTALLLGFGLSWLAGRREASGRRVARPHRQSR